ncbi:hypothetical protein H4W23_39750 [Streptomyces gardneri]|uniref:hypothetical protein n=1 Tax=Streptomyces gardneri TaxID=66892 RepID=UPI0006BDFF92|nr:hypothetical protein [Streptomyces gardneri]QPK50128.1 hypothetical protein H4W23_39750 [Streptomyces gardneri]WRK41717.1 hypothetical protein U0M97_39980 [Streptomyces venezuelae]CUM35743.1 hypothetical protein BN2537_451 [Streptomyces venezuelae]
MDRIGTIIVYEATEGQGHINGEHPGPAIYSFKEHVRTNGREPKRVDQVGFTDSGRGVGIEAEDVHPFVAQKD